LVVELADDAVEGAKSALELLSLAHQALRAAAVAPEIRGLGLAIKDGEPLLGLIGVKDAS
jgi:hypothetical protein